jgi:hypothetical protein
MNRKPYILFISILFTLLNAAVYEYEFNFSEPRIERENGHMLVNVEGCRLSGVQGEPLLPHYSFMIALPPGEEPESLELIRNNIKNYPVLLPLLPKQADRPYSAGRQERGLLKNEKVYELTQYKNDTITAATHVFRGTRVLTGVVLPVTYFPAAGNIELASSLTLRVRTRPSALLPQPPDPRTWLLKDIVLNPEILGSAAQNIPERMLIISKAEYAVHFNALMDFYKKYGIESEFLSVEAIEDSSLSGRDTQERIRNAIIGIYLEKGLDYLLIGGNSTIVPHRGLSCSVDSEGTIYSSNNIPADLYYAALDGDWDANGNSFFGEYIDSTGFDEADLLPELAVGRFPGANADELVYMIEKSMLYQAEPVIADMDQHVFFGESLWDDPETWGADYLDLLIGEQNENGYSTQGITDDITIHKHYDRDSATPWNRTAVKDELAAGRAFVHHSGHANTSYLMKFSTWDIQDSDFVIVNGMDHVNPVFYSHGCNCGGFDYRNNIASRLVNTPFLAVGGVFNSRYGWFNEGTTEGPAIHLHREFINALYGMRIHPFGWTHTMSRIATAPWVTAEDQHEQNALRWNFYTINVLGDPAMRLYSGTPQALDVVYDIGELPAGSLSATISWEGIPVSSARMTILDFENHILGIAESDHSGFVEVTLSDLPMSADSIYVHISAENTIPADTVFLLQKTAISIPEDYALLTVYPNPFNPETNIRFVIPVPGETQINVYDLKGRKVQELFNGNCVAGQHHIRFKADHLPAGIYICRLQSGATSISRKIVLLK